MCLCDYGEGRRASKEIGFRIYFNTRPPSITQLIKKKKKNTQKTLPYLSLKYLTLSSLYSRLNYSYKRYRRGRHTYLKSINTINIH